MATPQVLPLPDQPPPFRPNRIGYLYQQLADYLADRIMTGDFDPGISLPNERRLAEEYGVSLGTARHATKVLQSRGLVITVPSKGNFVAHRPTAAQAQRAGTVPAVPAMDQFPTNHY